MIKRAFVIAGMMVVSACGPVPTKENGVEPILAKYQEVSSNTLIASGGANGYNYMVHKLCDNGRAVYVMTHYGKGGITVVDDAPECA